ncbi:hypothetical protein EJ08DRAFT_662364 [Tothia fuscella]|uniref:Uncharacterized protein n=1 Tax=Tothia fuscella TaxID=1048955 RepID=A0A9P4NNJ3_9PEZI|nr:hypothetical protein EJ08DRAFT_662364 [Tothia fuscella]
METEIDCPRLLATIVANFTVNSQFYAEISYIFYREVFPKLHFGFYCTGGPCGFNRFLRSVGASHPNFRGRLRLSDSRGEFIGSESIDATLTYLARFMLAEIGLVTQERLGVVQELHLPHMTGNGLLGEMLDSGSKIIFENACGRVELSYILLQNRHSLQDWFEGLVIEGSLGILGQLPQ